MHLFTRVYLTLLCLIAVTPPAAAQATVATATPLAFLPTAGGALLSPNGERIAFTDRDRRICVYATTGGTPTCATPPKAIDTRSLQWSPDSTRLAFTENFLQRLDDPDIWVLDAVTGTLADLTDDGPDDTGTDARSTQGKAIDLAPQWTADGSHITFLRYIGLDAQTPAVCRVPATGGTTVVLGTLPIPEGVFLTYVASLSPGGDRIAYNVGIVSSDPQTGVWVAGTDGGDARQLAPRSLPTWLTFSPDGGSVLSLDPRSLTLFRWDESSSRVFTADGGSEVPVDRDHAAHWAGWQPGGPGLLYIVRDNARDSTVAGLYVVPRPGEQGTRVLTGSFSGPDYTSYSGLVWATNGTTIVRDSMGRLVLVRLGGN